MTPINITVLLHYYYATDDYNGGNYEVPSVRMAIDYLHRQGLIETNVNSKNPDDPHYKISERGQVYVKALMDVPLPVQAWVMPKGE